LALREDGGLWGWGDNSEGQVGIPGKEFYPTPKKLDPFLEPGEEIEGIGGADDFSWVVTQKGNLYMWGSWFRLGMPEEKEKRKPAKCCYVPTKHPIKVKRPRASIQEQWEEMAFWLFLGRTDPGSPFGQFPVEIIFAFVSVWNRQ
jgi:hypothetical protein